MDKLFTDDLDRDFYVQEVVVDSFSYPDAFVEVPPSKLVVATNEGCRVAYWALQNPPKLSFEFDDYVISEDTRHLYYFRDEVNPDYTCTYYIIDLKNVN